MSKRLNYNLTNETIGNFGIGTTSPNYKLHVVGDIFASGDITSSSDVRLKSHIEPINLSDEKLSQIKNLRGVSFKRPDHENSDQTHIGFVAQEVEKIIPEVVYTDSMTGYKSIAYGNMTAFLFEYIKHLNENVNKLNSTIENLELKIKNLEKNVE